MWRPKGETLAKLAKMHVFWWLWRWWAFVGVQHPHERIDGTTFL